MRAIDYLQKKEWSMGNGQCSECEGVPEVWHGHPCYMDAHAIGHEKGCSLAEALIELGYSPLMKGDYKSKKEYEQFISVDGIFGVRLKTKDGCSKYKKHCEQMQSEIDKAFALYELRG